MKCNSLPKALKTANNRGKKIYRYLYSAKYKDILMLLSVVKL